MQITKKWFKQIAAVTHARNLEFFRDKAALSWNILFPLFLIAAIYFGFNNFSTHSFKVGVIGQASELNHEMISLPIANLDYINFINIETEKKGLKILSHFEIDLLVDPLQKKYWFYEGSNEGYFLDQLIQKSIAGNFVYTRVKLISESVRYVDWVWIGILIINIMYGCLYGIGFVIVRYRKNGHLKRLQVTPLTEAQFLIAQVLSRIGIVTVSSLIITVGCYFFLNLHVAESISYITLILVFLLGTLSFISLGLLLCSRVTSEEFSRGLIEFVSWPMLICSGAWFSLEGTHPWLQKFAYLLPSTHFIEASRQLALYGATFSDVALNISFLAGSAFLFFLIGISLFKWQSSSFQR